MVHNTLVKYGGSDNLGVGVGGWVGAVNSRAKYYDFLVFCGDSKRFYQLCNVWIAYIWSC